MGRAVLADGKTCMAADNLDIQARIADIIAHLVVHTPGRKDRKGMNQRGCSAGRESGTDVDHVCLGNTNIKEALRILFRKVHAHRAGLQIRVKYIDVAAVSKLSKSAPVRNTS